MHVFSIGRSQHLYFQGVMRLFDWPNFLVAAMLLQVLCGKKSTKSTDTSEQKSNFSKNF